jgi:hypothetical protein
VRDSLFRLSSILGDRASLFHRASEPVVGRIIGSSSPSASPDMDIKNRDLGTVNRIDGPHGWR